MESWYWHSGWKYTWSIEGAPIIAETNQNAFFDLDSMRTTIDSMVVQGLYDLETGHNLKSRLSVLVDDSKYVLSQLGIHMAIGATFAYDLVPLPLGTLSRIAWVSGNRIYWTIKRDAARKAIHSWSVLGISAIPWVGYFAYTIPLRKSSDDLCFISANHLLLRRNGQSLNEYLEGKPLIIQRLILRIIAPKGHNVLAENQN